MAESNKKKRKKAAKPQPAQTKATKSSRPKDEQVEVAEVTQLDDQDYIEQEETPDIQGAGLTESSPYDSLITHRTASQPTQDKFSTKLKSGLSSSLTAVRTPKTWLWLGGIVALILLILTVWWQWQRSYVGIVNGQYIPTSSLVAFSLSSGGSDALTQLTQQYLIAQEAYQKNITISDDVIQTELKKIVSDSGGQQAYEDALVQYGIPEEHLIQQIRTKEILIQLTKDKVSVSDQDVQDYYNNNKETLDPDGTRGFDNIKELIRKQLTEQKQEAEFSSYVQTLTEKSRISNNLGHANLTFMEFLHQEVFTIPGDVAKLFDFSK